MATTTTTALRTALRTTCPSRASFCTASRSMSLSRVSIRRRTCGSTSRRSKRRRPSCRSMTAIAASTMKKTARSTIGSDFRAPSISGSRITPARVATRPTPARRWSSAFQVTTTYGCSWTMCSCSIWAACMAPEAAASISLPARSRPRSQRIRSKRANFRRRLLRATMS